MRHNLTQGSPEWHKHRKEHFNASDAAAMLGLSPYETRTQLLHRLATGTEKDIDKFTQSIFDAGHEAEAKAINLAETIIGDELYPLTCTEGVYSCSCDGLTMDGSVAWEHKIFNLKTIESMSAGVLPEMYMPQVQQILMVTGADKCLFMCSGGTNDN
jgi:putative phage-type endonuclease